MIDLTRETGLSLAEAIKIRELHRDGRSPHIATGRRWVDRGCLARDGTRVRLETVRVGSRIVTTREAVLRFLARLTGEGDALPAAHPGLEHRLAEAELSAMGI